MRYTYVVLLCVFMQFFALPADDAIHNSELFHGYTLRPAIIDDKDAMVQVQLKVQAFYNYFIIEKDDETWVHERIFDNLQSAYTSGFTFVLENKDEHGVPTIVAFLVMRRAMASSCSHILYTGIWAVDPDYREENLMVELYKHMLQQVEKSHPDILRVEGSATHPETIEIFEKAGFYQEGKFERNFKLTDGTYAPQIFYVWFNPNFDEKL